MCGACVPVCTLVGGGMCVFARAPAEVAVGQKDYQVTYFSLSALFLPAGSLTEPEAHHFTWLAPRIRLSVLW